MGRLVRVRGCGRGDQRPYVHQGDGGATNGQHGRRARDAVPPRRGLSRPRAVGRTDDGPLDDASLGLACVRLRRRNRAAASAVQYVLDDGGFSARPDQRRVVCRRTDTHLVEQLADRRQ